MPIRPSLPSMGSPVIHRGLDVDINRVLVFIFLVDVHLFITRQ